MIAPAHRIEMDHERVVTFRMPARKGACAAREQRRIVEEDESDPARFELLRRKGAQRFDGGDDPGGVVVGMARKRRPEKPEQQNGENDEEKNDQGTGKALCQLKISVFGEKRQKSERQTQEKAIRTV